MSKRIQNTSKLILIINVENGVRGGPAGLGYGKGAPKGVRLVRLG